MIAVRNKGEIMISWGDDGAVTMNLNWDAYQYIGRATKKSRSYLRAAEHAKELLGRLTGRIVESKISPKGERTTMRNQRVVTKKG